MASTTAICDSFRQELMVMGHDFTNGGDAFNWALYTSSATHGTGTTAYSSTNELAAAGNYTQTGITLANVTPTIDTNEAITDWADPTWTNGTFTAASTLLYNDTDAGNTAVAVWDFAGDQTVSASDFVLQMPAYAATTAILRLA